MDCSSIHSSVHGNSPAENTGVGCYALLQGISPTQGLNPGLLHCRRILYCLSHQASPRRKMKEIKIDQKLSGNIIPDYVFLKTEIEYFVHWLTGLMHWGEDEDSEEQRMTKGAKCMKRREEGLPVTRAGRV